MKYYDIEQGSDEWFERRLGKVTSSHFSEIMANSVNKKGEFDALAKWGDPAKRYAMRIALEKKTGKRIDTFQNNWMARGNDLEPDARHKYECQTFQLVNNGGLFIDKDFATSPDGLIDGGGIEIKCVAFNTHFAVIENNNYDTSYKWQITGQLLIAELDFVDFVSYCPEFVPEKELFIFRIERENMPTVQLKLRLEKFVELVREYGSLL